MSTQSLFFPHVFFDTFLGEPATYNEQSQVQENEDGYYIQLDAPGVKKEDLKITVENKHLLIQGERKGRPAVRRAFSLPDDVEVGAIEARFEDGVLELGLPKKAQAKPVQIQIGDGKEGFFQKLLGRTEVK